MDLLYCIGIGLFAIVAGTAVEHFAGGGGIGVGVAIGMFGGYSLGQR